MRKLLAPYIPLENVKNHISAYTTMDATDHAHLSAVMAKELLEQTGLFSGAETLLLCSAIEHHSAKSCTHCDFDEFLKDADVLQHVSYAPLAEIKEHEKARYEKLVAELGLRSSTTATPPLPSLPVLPR